MYWETKPDTFVQAVSDAMTRNDLERLLRNLHLCDNEKIDKSDKFCKVRPTIDHLNKKFLEFSFNGENKSIDESMVPYFGTHGSRQRINNKPVRVGYKIWVMAEQYGYVVQFDPYQGAKSGRKQVASKTNWGLGEIVVLRLMGCLPDNYFTLFRLLVLLAEHDVRATGVLNKKKLSKCQIMGDKELAKQPRGHVDQRKSTNRGVGKITVIGWNDNRAVYIASNCLSSQPSKTVRRWNKIDRKYIQVTQPNQFHCYNQGMGFVDRIDQNVAAYRIGIRMKKWWWAPFAWMVDVAVQNAWILHRINRAEGDPNYSLLAFRREIVNAIFLKYSNDVVSKRRMSWVSVRNVPDDVRLDEIKHYQVPSDKQGRCKVCKKKL